ncbi:MAG: hypothetical protein DWQ05_13740 [Calditrichaeota bacterium]|nr:MAG: hypothetical protein DWQ05_13740 [Calditrichota bacterium]
MLNSSERSVESNSNLVENHAGEVNTQYFLLEKLKSILGAQADGGAILSVFGASGSGKTRLLQEIETLYANAFHLAYFDISQGRCAHTIANEPVSSLISLRTRLSHNYFFCPIFDLLTVSYLYQKGVFNRHFIRTSHHQRDRLFLVQLWELLESTRWDGLSQDVLRLFKITLKSQFSAYQNITGLTEKKIDGYLQMRADQDIPEILADVFAEELNASIQMTSTPKKTVLLFDNYPECGAGFSDVHNFLVQKWLFPLIYKLNLDLGISVILTSQEHVPVEKLNPGVAQSEEDRLYPITAKGNIRNQGAKECWNGDFPEYAHIFHCLSDQKDELSPYQLGICRDIISDCIDRNKEVYESDFSPDSVQVKKNFFHMRKLLQFIGRERAYSLIALSAARYFDLSMYLYLGENLHFEATQPGFHSIIHYSFTESTTFQNKIYYRFYPTASHDMQTYSKKVLVDSHFYLEKYFQKQCEQGDKYAICEVIYHRNRSDWEKSIIQWILVFEKAFEDKDRTLLYALLDIVHHLIVKSTFWQGRVLQNIAWFFQMYGTKKQALHFLKAAQNAYDEIINGDPDDFDAINSKGAVIFQRGMVLQQQETMSLSTSSFAEAMICFSQLLKKDKSFAAGQLNNILIAIEQAKGYPLLDQSEERLKRYEIAQRDLDDLLQKSPTFVPAINTYSRLQIRLAREYQQQGKNSLVFSRVSAALAVYDDKVFNSSTGFQLKERADIYWKAACLNADYGYYHEADSHFRIAIDFAKEHVRTDENLSATLFLAEILNAHATLQIKYMQLTAAMKTLDDAEEQTKIQLWALPKNGEINNLLGSIALQKAEIFIHNYDFAAAKSACQTADEYFSNVRWFESRNIRATQGLTLVNARLAAIDAHLAEYKTALVSYERAVQINDKAVGIEQLSVERFGNALNLRIDYGDLLLELGQYSEAEKCYNETDRLYRKNHNLFPSTNSLQIVRAKYLSGLAKIYLISAKYIDAAELMDENLADIEKFLKGAPDHLNAMLLQTEILLNYCQLEVEIGNTGKAIDHLTRGLKIIESALENGITIPDVLNGKAQCLCALARIQISNGYFEQAKENLQQALNLHDEVLEVAEQNLSANLGKSEVYLQMAVVSLHEAEYEVAEKYCKYANEQIKNKASLQNNISFLSQNIAINRLEIRVQIDRAQFKDAEVLLDKLMKNIDVAWKNMPQELNINLFKVDYLLLQATVFERFGETTKAIKNCTKAIDGLERLAQKYQDSVLINNNLGLAWTQLADIQIAKGAPLKADKYLYKAIAAFESVLKFSPNNSVLTNNRANAMQLLATVQALTHGNKEAAETLEQSYLIYQQICSQNANDMTALYNQGLAAAKSAYLFSSLEDVDAALMAFKNAIKSFDQIIEMAPKQSKFYQKKGDAYLGSGVLFISGKQTTEAIDCLKIAVAAFDSALELREDNSHSLYNRGKALLHLGELQNQTTAKGQALWSYQQSRDCFAKLLDYDKTQIQVVKNLADVNLAIGELQVSFSQHNDAFFHYLNAVKLYEMVLTAEPENTQVFFNQAFANEKVARIHEIRAERAQAIKYYNNAKNLYHKLCKINPQMMHAHFELGNVLVDLGKIYYDNKEEHDAKLCFNVAIKSFSMDQNGFYREALVAQKRGQAQTLLADVLISQGNYEAAVQIFEAAMSSFDAAIERDAQNMKIYYDKGVAAANLAGIQVETNRNDEAIESYALAVKAYENALQLQPDMLNAHYNKALSLKVISDLYKDKNEVENAKIYLKSSIDQLTHAVAVDATNHAVLALQQHVQEAFMQFESVSPE